MASTSSRWLICALYCVTGVEVWGQKLEDKLLQHFEIQCQEQSDGRQKLLVFSEGMHQLIKDTEMLRESETNALALMHIKSVKSDLCSTETHNSFMVHFLLTVSHLICQHH